MKRIRVYICSTSCISILFLQWTVMASGNTALFDTGQVDCYDHDNKIVDCPKPGEAFYGQDANYTRKARPFSTQTIGGDVIVKDNSTHLIWQYTEADCDKESKFDKEILNGAKTCCDEMVYAGYGDWRLPDFRELESIVVYKPTKTLVGEDSYINPVFDLTVYYNWSSPEDIRGSGRVVNFSNGDLERHGTSSSFHVRCVRQGQ